MKTGGALQALTEEAGVGHADALGRGTLLESGLSVEQIAPLVRVQVGGEPSGRAAGDDDVGRVGEAVCVVERPHPAPLTAGATITHKGNCGQCSSLKNLSVYIRNPDLTDPVRSCGVTGMLQGEEANIECLMEIGFEEACAQIWYFNTKHTREVCLDVCMSALDAPHHQPDASLNDCIQCDEDQSGPIFKAVSGRTRRNSGLPSGLCRPCDSVYPAEHLGY